ncbi:MAG: SPOR domain-containing protein [Gemmatimonadales bacterium]|nr:SPOR domain-containing protein [Gemmatimonadales bacterium]
MTGVQLLPATLDRHIPELLSGCNVVALVPATGYPAWSAMNAWRVARSAAAPGRRTVLVDCVVDEPVLHTVAGAANEEGIVDAFLYGASLNHIAQPQPEPNLFFIPAGTFAPDPRLVLASPRWRRLSAGFRHEGALLLLFVPEERLASVAADLDGMVVLAPQGMDLAAAEAPGVAQAIGRGLPILAVVGDAPPPEEASAADLAPIVAPAATAPHSASPEATGARRARPALRRRASAPMSLLIPPPRRVPWAPYAVLLALALGAVAWLYRDDLAQLAGLAPEPEPPPPFVHHTPPPQPPPHPVDSLRYAIQVAAWPTLRQALRALDRLEEGGVPGFVTPVLLPRRRRWFRLHAGPLASRPAADSVLRSLRAARLATRAAAVVDAPLSVELAGDFTADSATAARARLRAAGLPVFALGQADRRFRLYAGAFENTPQAAMLLEIVTSTGGTGELVPRVGYVP